MDVSHNRPLQLEWNTERRFWGQSDPGGLWLSIYHSYRSTIADHSNSAYDLRSLVERSGTMWQSTLYGSPQTSRHGASYCRVQCFSKNLDQALAQAYENIKSLHCLGSYYRLDVGEIALASGSGILKQQSVHLKISYSTLPSCLRRIFHSLFDEWPDFRYTYLKRNFSRVLKISSSSSL